MTDKQTEKKAYEFNGDYKAKLNTIIDELYTQAKRGNEREERIQAVQDVTDAYVEQTGERPDVSALDRLATLVLREELTDATPWKTRNTEYPIESDRQIKDYYEGLSGEITETMASNGSDYRTPARRQRTTRENAHVDRKVKARNKERRRKYREFTKVQPVHTYYITPGERR